MSFKSFTRKRLSALVVLLAPLGACEQVGLLGPDAGIDPLAGAVAGETVSFEGGILEADPEAGVLVLATGLVVRVDDATAIDGEQAVTSLAQAAHLLEEGLKLVAWGSGPVESEDPPVVLAEALSMAVAEHPEDDDGEPSSDHVEYEGLVEAIDLEARSLVLSTDKVIRVLDATEISDDFGLATLEAAKAHLEAGDVLVAWGVGELEGEEPVTIAALTLVMKVKDQPSSQVGFEGHVAAIDLEAATLTLGSGKVVRVLEDTEVSDDFGLASLAAAKEHLEAGDTVVAWGEGELESEEPVTIAAEWLVMKVKEETSSHVEFEGEVSAVNVDAGTLTLGSGTVVRVLEETEISDDFGVPSLASAKEHLEAGAALVAWGTGEVESEEPVVIAALSLVMKVVD